MWSSAKRERRHVIDLRELEDITYLIHSFSMRRVGAPVVMVVGERRKVCWRDQAFSWEVVWYRDGFPSENFWRVDRLFACGWSVHLPFSQPSFRSVTNIYIPVSVLSPCPNCILILNGGSSGILFVPASHWYTWPSETGDTPCSSGPPTHLPPSVEWPQLPVLDKHEAGGCQTRNGMQWFKEDNIASDQASSVFIKIQCNGYFQL